MSPSIAPSKPAFGSATPARRAAAWRLAAVAAAVAAYAVLSHWLMVAAADRPWAVAVLFGPLVLALAACGWRLRQPWVLAGCVAGVALLAVVVQRGGVADVNRLYVLQHAGAHLVLACAFGITLRAGAKPLITRLAEGLHQVITPAMHAYMRRLTALWAIYFLGMVAVSLSLYALAPWPWWSLYCNLLTPLFVLLLFAVEHVLRYRRHPEFERVSLRAVFTAYFQSGTAGRDDAS